MKYDLLQLAWIVMAVITAYTGGKRVLIHIKIQHFGDA